MKIGLFGNTNNYPFILAEALRALGQDAVLILTSKELLHRPDSLVPKFRSGYPDWIVDASDLQELDYLFSSPNLKPVIDRLSACDALLLNYVGPSMLQMLQRPAIALLTGSDLDHYADPDMVTARTQAWDPAYKASREGESYTHLLEDFIQRQRWGIQNAIAVRYFPRGLVPAGDRLLDELGVADNERIFLAAVDQRVKWVSAPHNQPLRIFCATRLTWKLPVEIGRSTLDYKGSDIMIRGLAIFYRTTGTRLDIQLVRKGLHVKELEALIAEEGLADQVTWSDEMSLTETWDRFAISDIVFEQLSDSAIGMAGLDAMATGRPVIGNARRNMFEIEFGEAPPICQAKTSEEVSAQLKRLVSSREERERIGAAGRRYVEKHYNPLRAAQICLQRFEEGA
jgi:glycosyltransferase involved in cell wall biosynthesis